MNNEDIRCLSDNLAISNFEKESGSHLAEIKMKLKHTIVEDDEQVLFDLSLTENAAEKALILKITKDPIKQNVGEIGQMGRLKLSFPNITKMANKGYIKFYVNRGKILKHPNFPKKHEVFTPDVLFNLGVKDQEFGCYQSDLPIDMDSFLFEDSLFLFTLKNSNGVGGAQTKQFKELYELVKHCPDSTSNLNPIIMYVSGSFFLEKIKNSYFGFTKDFNKIEILRTRIKELNKKALVLTDNDLPKDDKQSFSNFIKNHGY